MSDTSGNDTRSRGVVDDDGLAESLVSQLEKAAESADSRDKIRTYIAIGVVAVFLVIVLMVIVHTLIGSPTTGLWQTQKEPAAFAVNVLTSVLLPVVTLVLGYYFGRVDAS